MVLGSTNVVKSCFATLKLNTTTYKNAKELAELMRGMKNYRPQATVLEAEFASTGKIGKNWKSSISVNAMSEKRKAHAKFIEMRNNGEEKTKKLRPLGEDENPIVVGNKADDEDDASDDDDFDDFDDDEDDEDDELISTRCITKKKTAKKG